MWKLHHHKASSHHVSFNAHFLGHRRAPLHHNRRRHGPVVTSSPSSTSGRSPILGHLCEWISLRRRNAAQSSIAKNEPRRRRRWSVRWLEVCECIQRDDRGRWKYGNVGNSKWVCVCVTRLTKLVILWHWWLGDMVSVDGDLLRLSFKIIICFNKLHIKKWRIQRRKTECRWMKLSLTRTSSPHAQYYSPSDLLLIRKCSTTTQAPREFNALFKHVSKPIFGLSFIVYRSIYGAVLVYHFDSSCEYRSLYLELTPQHSR